MSEDAFKGYFTNLQICDYCKKEDKIILRIIILPIIDSDDSYVGCQLLLKCKECLQEEIDLLNY